MANNHLEPTYNSREYAPAPGLPESSEELEKKMMQPAEMGEVIVDICTLPDHLVITRVTGSADGSENQPHVEPVNLPIPTRRHRGKSPMDFY